MSATILNPPDGCLPITLRVTGGKPMQIHAELMAECTSRTDGAPTWHDLVLYRQDGGGYALSLTTCRGPQGLSDVCRARSFATLDPALDWIEQFDPTADLCADIDSADRRISTADIALRAASLRQQADRVDQQYRAMVGELFYQLEIAHK